MGISRILTGKRQNIGLTDCGGKRWNGRSAPKVDLYPAQMKLRFEVEKGGE